MGLVDVSPVGFQSKMFWKLISSAGLKSWSDLSRVQTLCSSGRSSGFSSLLTVAHCARGGVYGKIVFQPLLPVSVCFSSLPDV